MNALSDFLHFLYHKRVFIILIAVFLGLTFYAGNLAFGNQSFSTLSHHQNLEKKLKDAIYTLQLENTKIQKKLFEIKGLEP